VSARPFFIVSSGRSGTAMLHKALSAAGNIEMHHEYMVNIVQPLAIRRYLGLTDKYKALKVLVESHVSAVQYSEAAFWGDSSNKLSWLIPELAELLPEARFVHLVRDGRKVASSYFHKLGDECYDDRSTAILQAHCDDPARIPAPPPEKKYWWPVPRHDDPVAQDAVRDLQIVVELLEELVLTPELDEVIVRFGLLTHLIGGLTGTPVVPSDEFAGAIDKVRDVRHDLFTTLGLNGRVEKQREVVDVLSARHCGPHGSNVGRIGPAGRLPGACAVTSCVGSGGPMSPSRVPSWPR